MNRPAWREKASNIVAKLCLEAYRKAQGSKPNHRRRIPKHVPYSVPQAAQELVECLNTNDEERAKSLFVKWAFVPDAMND